ncbi:MAG: hypothetical protein R2747_09385 [Pyrinomonadaceae bacterium]
MKAVFYFSRLNDFILFRGFIRGREKRKLGDSVVGGQWSVVSMNLPAKAEGERQKRDRQEACSHFYTLPDDRVSAHIFKESKIQN